MSDENNSTVKQLNRNSIFLMGGEYLYRVVLGLLGLLMIKLMPPIEFGRFISALALSQIVGILVEAGMGQVVTKEIAGNSGAHTHKVSQILTWRLITLAAGCCLMPLLCLFFLPSRETRMIAIWLTPGVLLLGLVDFLSWMLKGIQKAQLAAMLLVWPRLLLLILSLGALLSPFKIPLLVAAYFLAGLFGVIISWALVGKSIPSWRVEKMTRHFFREILPDIYKFGAIVICSVTFSRMDLVLVQKILGEGAAALYGCAARLFDALALLPLAVYGAYMPFFSKVQYDPKQLRGIFLKAFLGMLAVSSVVIVCGILFSGFFIGKIFGPTYGESAHLIMPLLGSSLFSFPNTMMIGLLLVRGDFQTMGWAVSVGLAFLIIFNVLFLSSWGSVAASWSRFFGEMIIFMVMSTRLWGRRSIFGEAPPISLAADPGYSEVS